MSFSTRSRHRRKGTLGEYRLSSICSSSERDLSAEDILNIRRGGGGSAVLSRFDEAREPSVVHVVTSVGGPNPSGFGPALTSPPVPTDGSRRVRGPRPLASPPNDETDTGSDRSDAKQNDKQNDKQRRVIDRYDTSEVQIIEGERRQQVEFEAETRSRPRRFACGVGDCRRRYRNIDKLRFHYQHSGAHGAIGRELLASGQHKWLQHSELTAATPQSIAEHSAAVTAPPTSPSPTKSAGSQSWQQGYYQSQHSPNDVVKTLPTPTRENISAAPPVPPDIQSLCSSTQKCVFTSQSSSSHIPAPPDKLHSTLFCWIKKANKLSGLIDPQQKPVSTASPDHQSQTSMQATGLRARLKTQRKHFMELLQLSEGNAIRYLLDIDTEIQHQSEMFDELEGRLEAAKKLRGEIVELQRLYESRTAATIRDLRAKALSRPLPRDRALFNTLDLVLTEITRCYIELDGFWTEEISRTVEALNARRIPPSDFERWTNTHTNLKQPIEFWKNELPASNDQSLHPDNACLSKEAEVWVIASTMSSTMDSLTSTLEHLLSSYSLECLPSYRPFIERVYVAFAANSELCLSFLWRCVDYKERVIGYRPPSIPLPPHSRVMASYDLREWYMRFQPEMTGISAENAGSVQGSRKSKAAYKKALCLEEKMNSGLNMLFEKLSRSEMAIDADDTRPDVVALEQLEERWERARDSVREALAILKNEPVPQSFYRSAPTAIDTLRSVTRRWTTNFVCFS